MPGKDIFLPLLLFLCSLTLISIHNRLVGSKQFQEIRFACTRVSSLSSLAESKLYDGKISDSTFQVTQSLERRTKRYMYGPHTGWQVFGESHQHLLIILEYGARLAGYAKSLSYNIKAIRIGKNMRSKFG